MRLAHVHSRGGRKSTTPRKPDKGTFLAIEIFLSDRIHGLLLGGVPVIGGTFSIWALSDISQFTSDSPQDSHIASLLFLTVVVVSPPVS